MHCRRLGHTGLETSVLGLGSSPFRDGSPETCAELMKMAIDLGINYFDTARSYLHGEETIGCLPSSYKSRLHIATKTGARFGASCIADLQRSLNTMKRDHIDVWMAHMVKTDLEYELCTDVGGFCDIAIAARQAGLVRAIGASFHAPTAVILRAIEERAFEVVMFQVNLIGRETVFGSSVASYVDVLLPAARANGVGVVAMKVLAGGEMSYGAPALDSLVEEGRNSIESAVRYVAMHPFIGSAVVGVATRSQLLQAARAVQDVNDDMLPEFQEWTRRVRAIIVGDCTRCGACVSVCPEGINVPKIFRQYDQHRILGMEDVARYRYSELERNASHCLHCGECQKVCPEDFDIYASLKAAHSVLQLS